ncbi:MAG: hypothetical protein WC340_15095 [Kiritimatiellia bacterium]
MKTMKWMSQKAITLTAVTLLAAGGNADMVGYSADTAVDTRTLARMVAMDEKPLDSRSYTLDWSIAVPLNTKQIIGTVIVIM